MCPWKLVIEKLASKGTIADVPQNTRRFKHHNDLLIPVNQWLV